MPSRIQSPSSIITYKNCPRKYFYKYIMKLQTLPTIHTARGKIIHETLEDFYKIDVSSISNEHYEFELKIILQNIFKNKWGLNEELENLNLRKDELNLYNAESIYMVNNWFESFIKRLELELRNNELQEAFKNLTPETEVHFISERYQVQGFIDAIHKVEEDIHLVDYKTSNKTEINDEFKLQLAIYCLLYEEKYGVLPKKVSIDFLRSRRKDLDVDKELLEFAKKECGFIQERTKSENIEDYPMKPGPLCKWSTGQCDFYDLCFGQKKLTEYHKTEKIEDKFNGSDSQED